MFRIKYDEYILQAIDWLQINNKLPDVTIEYEYIENSPLMVTRKNDIVSIVFGKRVELFRGLSLIAQYSENFDYSIQQYRNFNTDGIMFDNSRNAVMNINTAKKMICIMALMGLDTMYLYMEDTYEVPEYPYFGYLRGRFTNKEIKELDIYANGFGIELVPAIETLSHMKQLFRWDTFNEVIDINDILLVGYEKTYELIDTMLKSCRNSFLTDKINIGMDEASLLGTGKYSKKFGVRKKCDIFFEHLQRVLNLCKKYGFNPSIWSDMLLDSSFGKDSKNDDNLEKIKEKIDSNLQIIYWTYYQTDKKVYDEKFKLHKRITENVAYAGGAVKWIGFAPSISRSIERSKIGLDSAVENGIKNVFVTAWGDFGGEASPFCELASMQFYAERNYNSEVTHDYFCERLKVCSGEIYEDILKLETLNFPGKKYDTDCITTTKYLLYNDLLCGLFDLEIGKDYSEKYRKFSQDLESVNSKNFSYVYETIASLARILSLKCEISLKLRNAYCNNDKDLVKFMISLAKEALLEIEKFHKLVRRQWLKDNKIFGYEVQDIRLGALECRTRTAIETLTGWVSGKIIIIPELEEKRLPYNSKRCENGMIELNENLWTRIVSPGLML